MQFRKSSFAGIRRKCIYFPNGLTKTPVEATKQTCCEQKIIWNLPSTFIYKSRHLCGSRISFFHTVWRKPTWSSPLIPRPIWSCWVWQQFPCETQGTRKSIALNFGQTTPLSLDLQRHSKWNLSLSNSKTFCKSFNPSLKTVIRNLTWR